MSMYTAASDLDYRDDERRPGCGCDRCGDGCACCDDGLAERYGADACSRERTAEDRAWTKFFAIVDEIPF